MRHPPPGQLVDLGTHRLHITCGGQGVPTVVFDAALGGSSLSWSLVQPMVASFTRACAYDRAGFGWSDAGPLPRTAGRIANELHLLLQRAKVPGPYLLVGHSFGGFVTRLFTAAHPHDVAGLVLIEPAIPEQWAEPTAEARVLIGRGTRLCGYGSAAARHGLARMVSGLVQVGALGPARALVKAVSRGGLRREDEGILAPIWKLPSESRQILAQMWTQPKFFEALGSQIEHVCESAAEVLRQSTSDYDRLPLVVVSANTASEYRLQADAALARQSTRGRHVLAENSGHWVPLDAPDVVIKAILTMTEEVRSPARDQADTH
jgi:pimeloyl-ACP methyl ester carboxylesterase